MRLALFEYKSALVCPATQRGWLDRTKNSDDPAAWGHINILGQQGWELVAVVGYDPDTDLATYTFRRQNGFSSDPWPEVPHTQAATGLPPEAVQMLGIADPGSMPLDAAAALAAEGQMEKDHERAMLLVLMQEWAAEGTPIQEAADALDTTTGNLLGRMKALMDSMPLPQHLEDQWDWAVYRRAYQELVDRWGVAQKGLELLPVPEAPKLGRKRPQAEHDEVLGQMCEWSEDDTTISQAAEGLDITTAELMQRMRDAVQSTRVGTAGRQVAQTAYDIVMTRWQRASDEAEARVHQGFAKLEGLTHQQDRLRLIRNLDHPDAFGGTDEGSQYDLKPLPK